MRSRARSVAGEIPLRRGAVDVDRRRPLQGVERLVGQSEGEAEQLVVERAFLAQPRTHAGPDFFEQSPRELLVQILGRLAQFLVTDALADVDRLLRDLVAARDHHDEDARTAEWHKLNTVEHGRLVRRCDGKAHVPRRL
jgi:hypothetical protein